MTIESLIHKKEQQVNNTAYSPKYRSAVKFEIKQLKEINEAHVLRYMAMYEQNNDLNIELKNIKEKVFHFELLVVALFRIPPIMLGNILNVYTIPFLIAHFKGTTLSQEFCNTKEKEINTIRKTKGLSPISFK